MWQSKLVELVNGPYNLYGGKKALAEALGISGRFLRQLLKRRQQPSYELGLRIDKLHSKQCSAGGE
jgi:hypothetical protein